MSEILSHRNLQNTVKELCTKFDLKLKQISTREILISQIIDTIGNATEEQQGMLSPEAVDIYNGLLAISPQTSTVSGETEEDTCQAYGISYEGTDPECEACIQAEDCQEKTMQATEKAVAPKKEKKVKEVKEKKVKVPKGEGPVSRYGGWGISTIASKIEDMLWEGSTMNNMVSTLSEQFKKEEDKVLVRVQKHIVWLKNTKKLPITEEGGVYKAEVEFI